MRIAVATEQWFPDYTGGTARVVRETARALAARGHDVVVLAPEVDGTPEVAAFEGLVVRRTVRRGPLPKTWTDARALAAAARELDLAEFDVALAHHPTSAVGLARVAPALPIAYVFHASPLREAQHRRANGIGIVESARSRMVEPVLERLERESAERASAVLALSEFSRDLFGTDHPAQRERTHVVGGGVDIDTFSPAEHRGAVRTSLGIGPDEALLLTVRRLVGRMGIDVLLNGVARLHSSGRSVRLVVVGDGEERSRLEKLRDELELGDRVTFCGRLPDEAVLAWYRAADLFVLPTTAYEGFGMSTAEALACGTPVVGTPVGATGEVLRPLDPDLIAASATEQDLAETIDASLNRLTMDLRRRCRAYAVERLAWDAVVERWEEILETISTRQEVTA